MAKVSMEKIEEILKDEKICQELGIDFAVAQENLQQAKLEVFLVLLMKKQQEDKSFGQKLEQAGDAEDRYQLCSEYFDISREDYLATEDLIAGAAGSAPQELSDEDLEAVAGGCFIDKIEGFFKEKKIIEKAGAFFKGVGYGAAAIATTVAPSVSGKMIDSAYDEFSKL